MAPAAAGGINLLQQFRSYAGWSVLLGLASVIVPVVFGYVFYLLPIFGIVAGIRAIMRGQLIGGIVGIVLNAIGGLITLLAVSTR
jgi:hypothetical protein